MDTAPANPVYILPPPNPSQWRSVAVSLLRRLPHLAPLGAECSSLTSEQHSTFPGVSQSQKLPLKSMLPLFTNDG